MIKNNKISDSNVWIYMYLNLIYNLDLFINVGEKYLISKILLIQLKSN